MGEIMTKIENDALEELLRHSAPRPAPPAADVAAVRAELQQEWRAQTGRRRVRRRLQIVAIAATVVLGAFVAVTAWRPPDTAVVAVAAIDKTFGTVYLLGEHSELRPTSDLATVLSGQTIVTGTDAGLGIAWGRGGSLRVDENTRVHFAGEDRAFLEAGRVYFDSTPGRPGRGETSEPASFTLDTEQGAVTHVGTQYMAEVEGDRLIVSVREGQVQVDGRYHDPRVGPGQQATLAGSRQPEVLAIGRSGGHWDWVARTTPAADVNGWTLHEFLAWVSRELGVDVEFEGRAESIARGAVLRGTIDTTPAEALRLRLATAALDWRLEKGVLYISD